MLLRDQIYNSTGVLLRFLAIVAFCAYPQSSIAKSKIYSTKLGNFEILAEDQSEENGKFILIRLLLNKQQIYTNGYPTIQIPPTQITISNQPTNNCLSNLFYETGDGAHCCSDLLVTTVCGDKHIAIKVSLKHTEDTQFIDADNNGISELQTTDWSFAYYSVPGSDENLSFSNSPGMPRLLVFREQTWQTDHPGEYSDFYKKKLEESRQEWDKLNLSKQLIDEEIAGRAIREAYYVYMISGNETDSLSALTEKLPYTWKKLSTQIMEDISKATISFNPIEFIGQ